MKYLIKFSPIILLAALVINGMDILSVAPIALIFAIIVCKLIEKISIKEIIDVAIESAKESVTVCFVIMLAYILAEMFTITGVGSSVMGIALKSGVTGRTVALVCFIASCLMSVSTGTSWGTFAAGAPVFLWLNHMVNGNILLTLGALAGGAAFGDNIGLISDTTVMSSGMQNVQVVDRVRQQGVWSLLCVSISAILLYATGVSMGLDAVTVNAAEAIAEIPAEVWTKLEEIRPSAIVLLEQARVGMPSYLVIPVFIVIGLALAKVDTFVCLTGGIFSAVLLGFVSGTLTNIADVLDVIINGISDAGSWTVPTILLISALGGVMNRMNAFEIIAKIFVKAAKKVRHLLTFNGLLCLFANAVLSDELAQIATISPVIKNITDKHVEASEEDMYKLRLRNATFADALGVMGGQLIPWHVSVAFFISICKAVYPLYDFQPFHIAQYNYMAIITVVSLLVLTYTGWDRFIPLLKLPSEPDIKLIKNSEAEIDSQLDV